MNQTPEIRLRRLNDLPGRAVGQYVLYWMVMNRRTRYNFALQYACEQSQALGKPLLVLEALRCDYPWASDRLHRFVLQGMRHQQDTVPRQGVHYYAYVERQRGEGRGLLEALAERACLVVTDDYPCFFLPKMQQAVAQRLAAPLMAVDSNGLLPLKVAVQAYATAYAFRRFLQQSLLEHLLQPPLADPLQVAVLPPWPGLPRSITERWRPADEQLLMGAAGLADFPIDHQVGPGVQNGGWPAAREGLDEFLERRLPRYAEQRNHPDEDASSGLSPYLHFGHLSTHEVFAELAEREHWNPHCLSDRAAGKRQGWWGMSASAEAFLDQLVTWRELGLNMCWLRDDYDRYESLPAWARQTLQEHAGDPRNPCYSLEQFAAADTHDSLWNAAQTQLAREGRMHNYLRMLWGKKILHWSRSPQEALNIMIELNNRYAVDGRDPNSYSGIFWCLGRYDRPWGPERPIFGKIRYMTSDSARRKLRLSQYLKTYGQS